MKDGCEGDERDKVAGIQGGEMEEQKAKGWEVKKKKEEKRRTHLLGFSQSGFPLCQSSLQAPERDGVNEREG